MHRRFPFAPLLALVLAACSPSNGSEKKGGHPGMGMPPPEVLTATAITVEHVKPVARPLFATGIPSVAGTPVPPCGGAGTGMPLASGAPK